MAQNIINYGASANDGEGDSLRNAFIKTDDNFDQIWAAGPVGSNVTILNNTVSVVNTNGNLILSPNGIGIIQTNRPLYPRLDNTYNLGSPELRYRSIFVGSGGITANGNLTLGSISNLRIPGGQNGYVIQTDGNSTLSWVALPGSGNGAPGGANLQVQYNANGLFGGSTNFTFNPATSDLTVGNAAVGSISTRTVYANILSVNTAGNTWSINNQILTAPSGATWLSNTATLDEYISSATNGYINMQTYDASANLATQFHLEHGLAHINILNGVSYQWEFNSTGLFSAPGNITANGNVTADYFLGNGSQLSNLPGGVIQGEFPPESPNDTTLWWDDVTGRLYVWYTDVDGSQWVDAAPAAPGSTYGNANVAAYLASGNNNANIVTTGGIVAVSVETNTITSGDSTLVVVDDGLRVGGDIIISGDIIPDTSNVYSLGSSTNQWADLYVANATIYMNNVPISLGAGNVLTVNGNAVLTNNSSTTVSTTGNVTANYFLGNGSQLTGLPAPAVAQDISSTGAMSIMTYDGNIKYVSYATVEPASGNISAGNVSTTGNIAGNYFVGNGSQLTGIAVNTGNVTFNDVNIIGTGNLNLQPAAGNSEYLNIYLTAAADIHIAADGAGPGNVILGTDEGSNVAVLWEGNVAIQAGNVDGTKTWVFDTAGNLTMPRGGVVYETNIPFGGLEGNTIALKPSGGTDGDQQLLVYPTAGVDANHLHLTSGNLYNTELFLGNDNLYVKLANTGNVVINSNDGVGNTAQWTFGTDGIATLPGEGILQSINDTVTLRSFNTTSGNANSVYLGSSGGLGFNDQEIGGNWLEIFRNGAEPEIRVPVGLGNLNIQTASGNTPYNWTFDDTGSLTLPGGSRLRPLGANLDIFAGTGSYVNLITSDESSYMGVGGAGGYVVTAGGTWDFNTNGNLTAPGNVSAVGNIIGGNLTVGSGTITGGNVNGAVFNGNVAFGNGTVGGSGNITGGNLITTGSGGDITMTGGNITGVGNISAGNLSISSTTNISNVTINSYTSVPKLWFKGAISAPQNIVSSTDTVTIWNTNSDPLSWGNVTTGRITPNKAGWYEVTSRVQFDTNAAANAQNQINHQIAVNGNQQAISQLPNLTGNVPVTMISTAMIELNGTTDYITTTSWSSIAGNAQQINGANASMVLVRWVST
jgi:hypothetical protein